MACHIENKNRLSGGGWDRSFVLQVTLGFWVGGRGGLDMNEFIWHFEKAGGAAVSHSRPRYLLEFAMKAELIDLGFSGPSFTWRDTLCKKELTVNAAWQTRWLDTMVIQCPVTGSN